MSWQKIIWITAAVLVAVFLILAAFGWKSYKIKQYTRDNVDVKKFRELNRNARKYNGNPKPFGVKKRFIKPPKQ